eukprot:TRINITY_DN16842_c0_g1_i1.p1 TRINITY_DN16842_c0_g1~~TRINITY_DN16842_c0_g1_i1.p1  ORF type:complete len:147 (+),score=21.96 TRINITY_DN16842_c0_g1_i1:140-580(+)
MATACSLGLVAPITGLAGASLARKVASPSRPALASSFTGRRVANKVARSNARTVCFDDNFERKFGEPIVPGISLIGWILPSSIPCINGDSLSGLFFKSIGPELAHFPTGPAADSPFWLWMITWHLGLFLVLTLGQIGVQARKQGYL